MRCCLVVGENTACNLCYTLRGMKLCILKEHTYFTTEPTEENLKA